MPCPFALLSKKKVLHHVDVRYCVLPAPLACLALSPYVAQFPCLLAFTTAACWIYPCWVRPFLMI